MRKLLFVVAAAGLLLVALAPVAMGDDDNEFRASLNGYLEVPSIATAARSACRPLASCCPGSSAGCWASRPATL